MRMKMFFIQGNAVQEIAASKLVNHEIVVKKLANQSGLLTTIIYETKDRRPYNIERIDFQRIDFNELGVFSVSNKAKSKQVQIKLTYAFNGDDPTNPLPLPIAPELPNKEELDAIKAYIKDKYPILLQNDPYAFINSIKWKKELHMQQVEQMKKSHR